MSGSSDSCDVAIVGAGPAGMAAACVLAKGGLDVVVLDEQHAPGGQIYKGVEKVFAQRPRTHGLPSTLVMH